MNLIIICTNYKSITCGIGMYTYNLVKELKKNKEITNINIINTKTVKMSKIKLLFNNEIVNSIKSFILNKEIKNEKGFIIIEYPFIDWSIFNLLYLYNLKKFFINYKVILSIHEYSRVNYFRKLAIKFLASKADGFILTDFKIEQLLPQKPLLLRDIPSNIKKINFSYEIKRNENEYCFFGLINKAKAFQEMINAWEKFNYDKKKILNIYTSSDIEIQNKLELNINIFKNMTNEELSKEFQRNKYMILPIKPYIDNNNGSYKAGLEHGCIILGKFKKDMPFEYTEDIILDLLKKSINEEKEIFYKKVDSFENIGKNLVNFLKDNYE